MFQQSQPQQQQFPGGSFGMDWDKVRSAFASAAPLDDSARSHLVRVYGTLGAGCGAAAAGTALYLQTHIGYTMPLLASVIATFMLHSTNPQNVNMRFGYFMLIALAQGIAAGGLVELALYVDPQIVLVALGSTLAIFAGLSFAAWKAESRSYLYLGGMLYSALGVMSLVSLANFFLRWQILFNVNLYGGLVVFSLYVLFDTQLIIEKVRMGERDFVKHALELFMDLAAIFVRVLVVLLKNAEDKEKRRRHREQ